MLSDSYARNTAGYLPASKDILLPVGYYSPSAAMGDRLPGLQRSIYPGANGVSSRSDDSDTGWPLTDTQAAAAQATLKRRIQRRGVPSNGSIGLAISPEAVPSTSSSPSATLTDDLPRLRRPPIPGGSYEDRVRSFAADKGALSPVYEYPPDDESGTPSASSTFTTIAKSAAMVAAGLAVAGTALYFGGASTALGGLNQEQEDVSISGTLSRVADWMESGITSGITSGMSAISTLTHNWGEDGWAGGRSGHSIVSVWS